MEAKRNTLVGLRSSLPEAISQAFAWAELTKYVSVVSQLHKYLLKRLKENGSPLLFDFRPKMDLLCPQIGGSH